MKRSLLLLFCYVIAIGSFAQTVAERIDTYLTNAAKAYRFNGAVLLADRSGILLNKGYGWRDAAKQVKHDENSIFQIGSVTKQFTATVILSLQEKKLLSVKDKLSKYFPSYKYADKITIENLLTHTSGIFDYTHDSLFMVSEAVKPMQQKRLWQMINDKPLDFEPGSQFSYSNSGYLLLGYIIEKVTGKKYEQVVRQTIFVPAGMNHSGFDFTHLNSKEKSIGYDELTSTKQKPSGIVDSSVSFAAGAIYTTTGDLYKWNKELFTNDIVRQSSLQQAFTPYKNHYGYGWMIDSVYGKKVITHGGGIFGFVSDMTRIPEDSICIILLSNKEMDLSPFTRDIMAVLYNKTAKKGTVKKEITVDTAILQQYVGEYELAPTFSITVTLENGKLMAQATGQSQFELFAESESKFFLKVVEASIEFIKGADGKVEKLVLHQNGRDIPGTKTN